jgi:hypothetical protein
MRAVYRRRRNVSWTSGEPNFASWKRIAPLVRRIDQLSAAYVCHVQENQGQALCSVERHEGCRPNETTSASCGLGTGRKQQNASTTYSARSAMTSSTLRAANRVLHTPSAPQIPLEFERGLVDEHQA